MVCFTTIVTKTEFSLLCLHSFSHCPAFIYGIHYAPKQLKIHRIFFFFFYWSIVNLQCSVNYSHATKWFGYTRISSFKKYSFPLWFIIRYWVWFSVPYSRACCLSLLYIKATSATPNLLLHPCPWTITSLFSMSVILFLFHR